MTKTLPVNFLLKSFFFLVLLLSNSVLFAQPPASYVVDNTATDYTLIKALGLPGGKSAVIYRDNSYNYKCSILGSNGAVTSTFDFTSKMSRQNNPNYIEVNALGTSSGNIFITYTSSTISGNMTTNNARYLVLDQTGAQVNSGNINGANLGSSLNRFIQLGQLSNGNVVMIWLQSDNQSGGFRIFQPNGTPVTSDASFAGPASTIFNSPHLFWNNRVAGNPNGSFIITFEYYRGGFWGILFDNNGVAKSVGGSTAFNIDPAIAGSYSNFSALGLSNGNYMIAWAQNYGGSINRGYYKIISETGSTVKPQTALPTDMQNVVGYYGSVEFAANNSSSTPGFVAASHQWQNYDDYSNPHAKVVYYNFDLSGNYLSSQDGSPYFIADYNPVLSIYSVNPAGVGVAYDHYKSFTPKPGGYDVFGKDISSSFVGVPGASSLTVSSVSVPAAKTYKLGDVLTFIVNTSANVNVTGTPQLALTIGSSSKQALYKSGTGTSALTFTYTIASGDLDADGITIGSLTLNGGTINNGSGSPLDLTLSSVGSTAAVHVDGVAPTAMITSSVGASGGTTNSSTIPVTVTFSEQVTGFTINRVVTTNGTVSGFSGSGTTYTFNVTTAANGVVKVDVPAGSAQDAAGNGNTAASQFSITYAPATTVSSIERASTSPTNSSTVAYTVTFAAPVSGVSASNFSIGGTAGGTSISAVTGSGTTWTVVINTGSVDGTVTLALANATGISPAISTTLPYSGQTYTIDRTSPTLMITSDKTQLKAGESATITFTFSEDPASTFTNADVMVTGGILGPIAGTGTTRTAVFTPIANVNTGTASVTVAAGSYKDAAGNNGGAGITPMLIFDTQVPTVTSINTAGTSPTAATSVNYTVNFSETVTGVDLADFTLTTTSGTATGTVASVTGSGTMYSVTVNNITGAGGLRLDLRNSGTGVTDNAGNAVAGGFTSGQSYTIGFGPATITFAAMPDKIYGTADFDPGATSTNTGTLITYTSSDPLVATIVSGKIHIMGAGTTIITASQPAGNGYSAATDVQQSLTVTKANATLTLSGLTQTYDGTAKAVTVTTSPSGLSGVAITYSGTSTVPTAAGSYAVVAKLTNSNYTATDAAGTLIISTATPTLTFNALPMKAYGDVDFAPGATSNNTGTPITYTSSNTSVATIVSNKIHIVGVGTTIITASQAAGANYSAATGQQQSLTINPKSLTVTLNNTPAISKIYDGTTTAIVAAGNYTLNGVVGSDAVTVSGTASYDNANAGTGKTVTVNNFILAGAQKDNYTLSTTSATTTAIISARPVTVMADAKGKVYGQSDPALTYTSSPALLAGDSFTGSLTRDAGENAGTYAITQGTLTAGNNYSITYAGANLAITRAVITIAADAKNKVYGGSDPALTYHITSGILAGGDTFSGTLTRDAGENAGSYAIKQGTLSLNANYTVNFTGAILTINKAALTIIAEDKSKAYGQLNPVLTASYNGFVKDDSPSSLTTQPTLTTTATASSSIGNYTITASGAAASNYTISYVEGNFSITQATLTITADNKAKVYGAPDPELTYTIDGLFGSDVVTGNLARVAGNSVGVYTIQQGTVSAGANYTITYNSADLTISPKVVSVTVQPQSKVYGDADPVFSYTGSPALVSGDAFSGTLGRMAGEDVGAYAIHQGTLTLSSNYILIYTGAQLTITKKAITITAEAKTKTFGDADPALTYTISPVLVSGDSFTGVLSRTVGENVGTYAIIQNTLALSSNYEITYRDAGLTIGAKNVTIIADAKSKTYGDADPALTYTVSGLVGSDALSGTLVRTTGEDVGHYAISQGSITAGDNYLINYSGADLTIASKALVVSADVKTKVYGDADPVLTYNISGLVGNDAVTGELARTPGNKVGTYAIQQGSLTAGTNYTISYTGANLTIIQKAVTVAAQAKSKSYGQPDPSFAYTVTPALVNGDVLSGALSRTPGEDAGTYSIKQGSLTNPNYAISFTEGVLTIEKAAQQITWVQTLTAGCDGISHMALTATASSGLPVSYSSPDATIAIINGNEVVMTGAGTVTLTATQPGSHNYLPATPVTNTMTAKLPEHLVVKRWDDVLVFDNSSNQYTAWQWYKDGLPINGAAGQYYYESGKLNGSYQAVVKTINGVTQQTCPVTITPANTLVPIAISPNPVAPAQTITVKTGYTSAELQGATIVVSNMLGVVVQTVQTVTPQTNITMPLAQGLYVIKLRLANGVTASVNALVKPQ